MNEGGKTTCVYFNACGNTENCKRCKSYRKYKKPKALRELEKIYRKSRRGW